MDDFYSQKYNLDGYNNKSSVDRRSRDSYRPAAARSQRPKTDNRRNSAKRPPRKYRTYQPTQVTQKLHYSSTHGFQQDIYSKPPKKKKTVLKRVVIVMVIVLLVGTLATATCFLGYNIIRENKKKAPFKFSEKVKISGISIAGLSMNEAKEKLKKNALKAVDDFKLKVIANDKEETYDKSDFSYTFDYDTPLNEAKIYSLKEQDIYDPPEGSTESVNRSELKIPELTLEYKLNEKSVPKISKALAKEVDSEPVNAKVKAFHPYAAERFEYQPGVLGYSLQEDDLTDRIIEFFDSGKKSATIYAEVSEIYPEVTMDVLRQSIVGLSTVSLISNNTPNGNINMKTALDACNGSVIEAGEVWSFNDCTGDSNDPKNGYKKATVITDRKLEEGIGGGICQASTTIFQAAMFANMDIYERHNHFWASGYAFSGEDATIDYPGLDLKLYNPTEYQMFIECKMEGTTLMCSIYGVQEDYYDNVKIYTKNYDIVKKKTYSTHTYRVLYLNGEVVSETLICESGYSLTDKHAVQDEDKGTYRVMVDGTTRTEKAKTLTETDPDTTEASTG